MNAYIFRVSMESIELLATIENVNKKTVPVSNAIECVPVIEIDHHAAWLRAQKIRADRIAFVQKIVQNPIQSIGQAGNGF